MMLVKLYQMIISPWLGPHCRFEPCCSSYVIQAFQTHGCLKATALSIYRLLRCQPLSRSGYDPVPSSTHHYKREQQS